MPPVMEAAEKYVQLQIRKNVSPLRYPGGKRGFVPFLSQVIQANGLTGCRYLEPYAGGAGAALELFRTGVVSSVSINDKDPAIYWFWKAVLTEGQRFVDRLLTIEVDVTQWRKQREILRAGVRGFDLGFAAFYLNRTCVSGVIKRCGGPIGGYDQSGKYKINCRFHREALAGKVKFVHDNRQFISISNMDAITFLRRRAEGEDLTFTYLDPPYYHKASELYLNSFLHADHEVLRDFLLGPYSDQYWVLSYDYCDEITELYRHQQFRSIKNHHRLANKGVASEFIAVSDRTKTER
jgi:DNA adenine methylase